MVSLFFFFKQKTAYEMRISDWSSDVCSSDLAGRTIVCCARRMAASPCSRRVPTARFRHPTTASERRSHRSRHCPRASDAESRQRPEARRPSVERIRRCAHEAPFLRSEEHTSELQSLMRISYAVYCLKKKNTKKIKHTQ